MSHRLGFALVLLVLLAFAAPALVSGDVVLGHDIGRELGASEPEPARYRKTTTDDETSFFLPEVELQLGGARSGWIATWNPHVELGLPALHLYGFSRAYLPALLVSCVTSDPLVAYSLLVVLALLLTAAFGYGFLRALDLAPAACACGALGLALGVFVVSRLNAVLFVWSVCWTLALLWAVARFTERPSVLRGVAVAFAIHALFLSGYPQQIVWHGYLVVGFALARLLRRPGTLRERGGAAALLAAAALAGVASVLPVLLDLATLAGRSSRTELDPELFTAGLPRFKGLSDALLWVAQRVDPFWFGDPVGADYPLRFDGLSTGAFFGTLLALSLAGGGLRRLWPWHAFVGLAFLCTLSSAAFGLAVRHLGFSLSRFGPLAGAYIPGVVLAACAVDRVLAGGVPHRVRASFLALSPAALGLLGALRADEPLDAGRLAIGASLVLGVVAFVWTRRAWLVLALCAVSSFHYGSGLVPRRPLAGVPRSSPLVEAVRAHTADGSRFLWVGDAQPGLLLPNLETLLGLRSVHAYDPLASDAYRELASSLSRQGMRMTPPGKGRRRAGEEPQGFGRHFRRADADLLRAPDLSRAGIGLLLSGEPLDPSLASPVGEVNGIGLYRTTARPILQAQIARWREERGGVRTEGALDEAAGDARRTEDRGDHLRFALAPVPQDTVLFVSQQFHPHWRAFAGARELATTVVDGLYLGVRVPPGTAEVELAFRPRASWAWLPIALFAAAGALSLLQRVAWKRWSSR